MARSTTAQANFNGGVIAKRLHARSDLNLYGIALADGAGWLPLVEGGLDLAPGTIRIAAPKGPCRLVPFSYSVTQSYIVEMSAGWARFYTNDNRIDDGEGNPIELALPYADLATINALTWEQSYDVLYLFHGSWQTRGLVRTDADEFELVPLALENGPFEPRNKDKTLTVVASGVVGDVTLTASAPIFEAGDVGGLFQMEADDFGDIASWEPGITTTAGQLVTWNERVYRKVGGQQRTGTVAPVHNQGVEWDGIGAGLDINDEQAGGVQWEYIHDRFGVMRITGFTSATVVTATVQRQLPFTASGSYDYEGGYWDDELGVYVPPTSGVSYNYGTWRWRFGAFSNRRGWPTCGCVWNERLVLAKGSTIYGSVTGDLTNHATYNELGEISADMAFVATVSDPNGILSIVPDEKLKLLTPSGLHVLGPSNAAQGVGPGNLRVDRQNNEGAADGMPVQLDGRTIYIGKSRRRVIEGDYVVQRDRQDSLDLTRYARHLGASRFVALASTKDPARLLWACRDDGLLLAATYVPEEQVLGWMPRPLAPGIAARSIASCADPSGELDQLWIAAEFGGAWHVLLMAQPRQEGDAADPPYLDLAAEYSGAPASSFGPVPWLVNRTCEVWADERAYRDVTLDSEGRFTLPVPAAQVWVGLAYDKFFTTLRSAPADGSGSALGKAQRISRITLDVLDARGLEIGADGDMQAIEQLRTDSVMDEGFAPVTGAVHVEDVGDWGREGTMTVRSVAPVGATVRALQPTLKVSPA